MLTPFKRCASGKVPFWSQADADEAAARISRKPPVYGPPIVATAYCCSGCGQWHIGRKMSDSTEAVAQPQHEQR